MRPNTITPNPSHGSTFISSSSSGQGIIPVATLITALATLVIAITALISTCQTRKTVSLMEKRLVTEKNPILYIHLNPFDENVETIKFDFKEIKDERVTIYYDNQNKNRKGVKISVENRQTHPYGAAENVLLKIGFHFKRFDNKEDACCYPNIHINLIQPGGGERGTVTRGIRCDKMEFYKIEIQEVRYKGVIKESGEWKNHKSITYDRGTFSFEFVS